MNGNRPVFQFKSSHLWHLILAPSSLSRPRLDYCRVSHAESVKFVACVTRACTPRNRTLFKQSGSETEDSERVETVIIPADMYPPEHRGSLINQCSSEYSGAPDKHTEQPPAVWLVPVGARGPHIKHSRLLSQRPGDIYSLLSVSQGKPPCLWTCLLEIPHKCATLSCDCWLARDSGAATVAPLCAGAQHGTAGIL